MTRRDVRQICCKLQARESGSQQNTAHLGGDRVKYPGDCGTPTVDLLTINFLLNSIVSTPGAKFMTIGIKYFYLNTPMERSKYMRMKISNLPADFVKQYNIQVNLTKDGYIYI